MGYILHQHVFATFKKQQEENEMSACMSNVCIIFQPRLIALFSFFFNVSLLNFQHIESWNAHKCFSMKGHEKMAHGRKFSSPPMSTGRKVEMAGPNAVYSISMSKCGIV